MTRELERLNKVLARAGVCSRRAADRLIADGRVEVAGHVQRDLGTRVDPERDAIRVDGKRIAAAPATHLYFALHKPRGYVTTLADPEGRPSVRELLEGVARRVFPVGRLDFHSEGLLLVTDDGALCRDLLHPSRAVPKTYEVKLRRAPGPEALARLSSGVTIDGRKTRADAVRRLRRGSGAWIEIVVHEGRTHLVRRMCEAVGHPVQRLRRVEHGGVRLGRLAPGALRPLTDAEVAALRRVAARRSPRPTPSRTV